MSPDNDNALKNVPPSDDNDAKYMSIGVTASKDGSVTQNNIGPREAEPDKADEESGDEFDHVSDSREKFRLIMDQMLNMDDDEYDKKYPPPPIYTPIYGAWEAFKLLKELCEDTDDEDEAKEAEEVASSESQPTKK
ncbi:hypothetical protein V502_02190 [Pseudogymnoascus sp. VKM F-4520 (FW-2644)]|nr:hypothetical protein V502_02190 [Pseudogymnoascus sp. VKM F-4520 (FW-2644)]